MKNNNKAFTLIELLVVVLIIGILAAVALPQYEKSVMKSRYSALMAMTKALADAEETYYLANGEYTADMEELAIEPSGCTLSEDKQMCTYPWGWCHIGTNTGGRVVCSNTQTLQNSYVLDLQHSTSGARRRCWSLSATSNDKYGKLCQFLGATYQYAGTCPPDGATCYLYQF